MDPRSYTRSALPKGSCLKGKAMVGLPTPLPKCFLWSVTTLLVSVKKIGVPGGKLQAGELKVYLGYQIVDLLNLASIQYVTNYLMVKGQQK